MGIPIEFNPDLALRNIAEFKSGKRKKEECVPDNLEVGQEYDFFKKEQRCYWLTGAVPLIETSSVGGTFSSPLASIRIMEATHFLEDGVVCTKGKYKILKLIDKDEGRKLPYDFFQRNGFEE
ncbi:MAG: hypothetical protein Q7S80_00670 [bacterium]|nr:hypothetical protein [bacterium]